MPAQALYLKYRPQTFEDVQGQEYITHTLRNALELNRIAHAYLFTGTRGTGKTSTARILAKAVNCLDPDIRKRPCNRCEVCRAINEERLTDLIEIDAASNSGVDNIRDLRDKIDFRPGVARFKVYIIDEAHMLSNAAFNALLKTLEEPPPHVIFVLATTEVNRLPATITSRCQRFDFKRATLPELISQLGSIAAQEGMQLEPAALELVARQANGSFRDGTSLLDQLTAYSGDVITLQHVQNLLGAASRESIHEIVASLGARDVARGIAALDQVVDAGADPRQVARDVVDYLRGVMLFTVNGDAALNVGEDARTQMRALAEEMSPELAARAIRLFSQAALDLRNSTSPTLPLEMAVVETTFTPAPAPSLMQVSAPRPAPVRRAEPNPLESSPVPAAAPKPARAESTFQKVTSTKKKTEAPPPEPQGAAPSGRLNLATIRSSWPAVMTRFHRANRTFAPFLKDAEPVVLADNNLTIGFFYDIHQARFDNDKNARPQLEKILQEIFGAPLRVKCVVSPKRAKMQAAQDDPVIRAAMNLGGKIVDVKEDEE